MWACFEPSMELRVLQETRMRIRDAYSRLIERPLTENEANPIRRTFLLVTGDEEHLVVQEAYEEGDEHGDDRHGSTNPQGAAMATQNEQIRSLYCTVRDLRREIRELKIDMMEERSSADNKLNKIMAALNRLSRTPPAVFRPRNAAPPNVPVGDVPVGEDPAPVQVIPPPQTAVLSSKPANLYTLWAEWHQGVGGLKPARLFTAEERGRSRFKFSRRKIVWDAVQALILSGDSHQVAVDKIYQQYGENLTVSQIISKMQKERTRTAGRARRARRR